MNKYAILVWQTGLQISRLQPDPVRWFKQVDVPTPNSPNALLGFLNAIQQEDAELWVKFYPFQTDGHAGITTANLGPAHQQFEPFSLGSTEEFVEAITQMNGLVYARFCNKLTGVARMDVWDAPKGKSTDENFIGIFGVVPAKIKAKEVMLVAV